MAVCRKQCGQTIVVEARCWQRATPFWEAAMDPGFDPELAAGQVAMLWNHNDVGIGESPCTVDFLMHGIASVGRDSLQMIGQEEHDVAMECGYRQGLKRFFNAVMRMSLAMSLEPVGVSGFSLEFACEVDRAGVPRMAIDFNACDENNNHSCFHCCIQRMAVTQQSCKSCGLFCWFCSVLFCFILFCLVCCFCHIEEP